MSHWVISLLIGALAGCTGFSGSNVPARFESDRDVPRLVDLARLSLYTYDRDRRNAGQSACSGDCVKEWPPLLAGADAKPAGDFRLITREDGRRQWTYKGRPLHRYAGDRAPGEITGDGQANLWRLAR